MPGPNDPYQYSVLDARNFRLTEEQQQPFRKVAKIAGMALVPGLTSALTTDWQNVWENVPGLDFALNPDQYPKGASFLNPTGWNTYSSRKAKEQAGAWKNQPYQYGANDDPVTLASQNGITTQQLLDANPGGYPFSVGQNINMPSWVQTPQTQQAQQPRPQTPRPTPAGNTDYANTAAAQYYKEQGTPFLEQKRWDPQRKKYISVGKWLKQSRRGGRRRGGDDRPQKRKQEYALANTIIDFGLSAG